MTTPRIDHLVVLMLENRSFDHLLGTLPGVNGVLGPDGKVRPELVNHTDPTDATTPSYRPKLGAQFATPKIQETSGGEYGGPSHSFPAATQQLFGVKTVGGGSAETTPYKGGAPKTTPPTNSGFVESFMAELDEAFRQNGTSLEEQQEQAEKDGTEDPVQEVMEVFTADQLPAIHALAREFCVCDRWHSEIPGPTEPNRLFTHAGTSTGLTYNPWSYDILDVPTIYDRIAAAGRDWAMYGFDLFDSSNFDSLVKAPEGKLTWSRFLSDAAGGKLPYYSFLCPRYSEKGEERANSQHAPHDVRYGDELIADVYQAVRNGPGWGRTLLVVTYDEHGGYYDHVVPPAVAAPDGNVSPNAFMEEEARKYHKTYLTDPDYDFDFTTLGFRVPAVLVSPWIPRGGVDSTPYRHTSILRWIADALGTDPLTRRDATAASFAAALSLDAARDDCPETVPAPDLPAEDPELVMKAPPSPKQDEWTRRYTAKLAGHRDTRRRLTRPLPDNETVRRYIAERNRRDAWARSGDWEKAAFEVYRDRDGRWRWHLKDGDGDLVAASTDAYPDENAARLALDRARFLSEMLGDVLPAADPSDPL